LEASVATSLLEAGAASVVAMAYSVYAVAAAEFMAAFYERLFAGDTVSAAVAAGRQQMFRRPGRPSPKGDLPLADWLVPVHYLRHNIRFPGLVTPRPRAEPQLAQALDQLREPGPGAGQGGDALAPIGDFVGRDGLFYELEAAARLEKVAVLYGPAGVGKTELAKAFGRWWRDTGGVERPEWVLWHSFDPGLASFGLEGVLAQIGLSVFGPDFARLEDGPRAAAVRDFLRTHRALLIWDNFESIRSLPDHSAAAEPLDEPGRAALRGFLQDIAADSRSMILITSRSEEQWLDEPRPLAHIQVPGLTPEEAAVFASELLAPHPAAGERRASRAFGDLMTWLDGHPLSMRLILPHLAVAGPEDLLAELRGTATAKPQRWRKGGAGRLSSLQGSLDYSYDHLDPQVQRLLKRWHGPTRRSVSWPRIGADCRRPRTGSPGRLPSGKGGLR
jgi:CHAT domain